MRLGLKALVSLVALTLSSCAALNEGATDVRRIAPVSGHDWVISSPTAGQAALSVNDTVLITVDQIFIHQFEETNFEPNRVFGGNVFDAHGEVALLVGVPTSQGPASYTTTADHLLVFYSNDVMERQFLNLRNQRVFGPAQITNDRFEMEFLILELDRTSAQQTALLTKLADLGKTYAGVTGPVGGALVDLGAALLSAQNDDVELRYRFTMDLGGRAGSRLPMYPGFYVLVNETDRRVATAWNTLCLDAETGRLYRTTSGGGGACGSSRGALYTDETYITLHVQSGGTATNQTMTTFAAFGTALAAQTSGSLSAINDEIDAFQARNGMEARRRAIWNALAAVDNASTAYGSLVAACPLATSAQKAEADGSLLRAGVDLHRLLTDEIATMPPTPAPAPGSSAPAPYDAAAYGGQLARLVNYFGVLFWEADPTKQATMLNESRTSAKFIEIFGDLATFTQRVQSRAHTVWPAATTCP